MDKFSKRDILATFWGIIFLATPLLYNACSNPLAAIQSMGFSTTGTEDLSEVPADKLTFSQHIAPIIGKNCTSCHNRGNALAPFPLETYDDVAQFADSVKYAIENRTMPPPGVDNSGDCQQFSGVHWMSDEEIQTVSRWFDNGMKPGAANPSPITPEKPDALAADITVQMPQAYTPQPEAGKIDDYRCFLVDPQVANDTYITGLDIHPDRDEIVHHIIVFKPTSAQAQSQAEAKLGADGRPGYSCFGAAGVAASVIGLWAPGGKPLEFVDAATGEELGLKIEAGRKLIMQVHYNTQNGVFADQSSLSLKFSDNATPVRWLLMANILLNLPPGQADVDETSTQDSGLMTLITNIYETGRLPSVLELINSPPAAAKKLYAVAPHMHTLGKSIQLQRVGGDNSCLARVPKWDFNWQSGAMYKTPVVLAANESLKLTCNFSTVGRTDTVTFGEGTGDEMCLAFVLAADL